MTNDEMTDGQQIRERMWDYVYGLLSEEESQEMVARIKSDPQIARLYAEVRLKGELVAQAALVEDSSLHLKAGADDQPTVTRKQTVPTLRNSTFWHQRAKQLIALAVCGLIVILGAGLCWPRPNAQLLARNFVATDVVAPLALPGGLTNSLALHTYHVNPAGEAAENASAEVQIRLVDSSGKEQFQKTLRTDASGQANFEIPGAALEPGTRLEVNPSRTTKAHTVALNTELPVEPEPEITYFLSKEPVAEPPAGAAVSTWNFNAFSAKPIPETQSEIVGVGGELQARDAEQFRGSAIANGYQQQYANRSAGRILAGQVPAKALAKQESAAAPPQVVEAGQAVQVDIPPQLSDKLVDVAVLCRGVTVAATSENETAAKDSNIDEAKLADRKAKIGQRQVSIPLPPEVDGLMEVEVYDQNSDQPIQRNLIYRQPLRKLVVQIPNFQSRVAPGDDIELKLNVVDEKGNPAANTRVGVRVWNEPLVQQLGDRPLLLTDAVLKGQGFEYAQNAQVPANQLNQQSDLGRLKQQARSYQRSLRATPASAAVNAPTEGPPDADGSVKGRQLNETQQLASAQTIPAAKIELASNREAVKLAIRNAADESTARRERAMRILGAAAVIGGIAVLLIVAAVAAMKMAASARVFVVPLITAVASLLIGVSWLGVFREHSMGAIAMTESAASKSAPANDMAGTSAAASLQENLRRESQPLSTGGPAPAAATAPPQATPTPSSLASSSGGAAKPSESASLRLAPASPGLAGGMPGGFGASSSAGMPARAPAAADTSKAAEAQKKVAYKDLNSATVPPSIYFNADLMTDENGNATIRFKMPSVPCEYRLLIDALGHSRIGSRSEPLICGTAGK